MLALVVAALALVVAGWIGYRATGNPNATVCFRAAANAVVCVDTENPQATYRITALDTDRQVVSYP